LTEVLVVDFVDDGGGEVENPEETSEGQGGAGFTVVVVDVDYPVLPSVRLVFGKPSLQARTKGSGTRKV
jgi:hypothetical protein